MSPNLIWCSNINESMILIQRRRIIYELMRSRYRSSDSEIEQIGGLEPPQPIQSVQKPARRLYSDEQVESALELLTVNSLGELGRQDFSAFGKKRSWIQLATGCVDRLATDLLLLQNVGEVAERCDLLYRRLEVRRAAKVRTPHEAQKAITDLYHASRSLRELEQLRKGRSVDTEGAIARARTVMGSWRAVSELVPVQPKTSEMTAMVRAALHHVLSNGSDRLKNLAQAALAQWGEGAPVESRGERIEWDSD